MKYFFEIILIMIIFGCKSKAISPNEAAEIYCNCIDKNIKDTTQNKYIICNDVLKNKSELLRKYFEKSSRNSKVKYSSEDNNEIRQFVHDFLDNISRICPDQQLKKRF